MNSTIKTILMWLLILVAAVGLYNIVENRGGAGKTWLDLTEFLAKVDQGQISDVTINGSSLQGHLRTNNEAFTTTIPADYSAVYDRLVQSQAKVIILPPEYATTDGLSRLLIVGGLAVWFAISTVILILLVDLSRFVKRQLDRTNGSGSVA